MKNMAKRTTKKQTARRLKARKRKELKRTEHKKFLNSMDSKTAYHRNEQLKATEKAESVEKARLEIEKEMRA